MFQKRRLQVYLALWFVSLVIPAFEGGVTHAEGSGNVRPRVKALKVLILSTMLAEKGVGEWGFAALVEADGNRILFDTGRFPDTVLKNVQSLGVDLSGITEVVLSHHHYDHTGGLLTLRRELSRKNPKAVSRTHVAKGIFLDRYSGAENKKDSEMASKKADYEATGGVFVQHDRPAEVFPGVWLTGPVPRRHPERNWSGDRKIETAEGLVEDNIPEDQSLVIDTDQGLVILSGCGHAGIVNTVEYSRDVVRQAPIHAALGGFHLFSADENHLEWTSSKLREFGLGHFVGAHCTGLEAVYQIRDRARLSRPTCVVGAVGASFTLEKGINPLGLAR